jgi:nitroreductase
MEFKEVLERRRMVRNYREVPIDPATLSRVASAALRAPSAGNSQGVSVVVVTDRQRRQAIADLGDEAAYVAAGFDPWISRAPAHIVISISEQTYHDRYREPDKVDDRGEEIEWPVPYWWVDAGAAMMAVLLAAVDEGLAAGFLGVHSIPDLRKLLEIPDHFSPIGLITVGQPAPDRRSTSLDRGQRPLEETLRFETYTAP